MDGSNVIELSADGVFDIPSIPVAAQSPSRPCCVARIADVVSDGGDRTSTYKYNWLSMAYLLYSVYDTINTAALCAHQTRS